MVTYRFAFNTSNFSQISSHLIACNNLFVPPLLTRVNIQEYSRKLETLANRFEAWYQNELIGLVAAYMNDPKGEVAFISNVSVDTRHTGKGIARQLLILCIEKAAAGGFITVELEVSKGSEGAIHLYYSLGFTFIEKASDDSIKLALKLTGKNL